MDYQHRLVQRNGEEAGKIFVLENAEISIGRERNNDIVINDVEVSRKHVVLSLVDRNYTIQDQGSTNGTFVDGERLTAPYKLHGGEIISLGEGASYLFEVIILNVKPGTGNSGDLPTEDLNTPSVQPINNGSEQPVNPIIDQQPINYQIIADESENQGFTADSSDMYSDATIPPEDVNTFVGQVPENPPLVNKKRKSTLILLVVIAIVILCCIVTVILIDQTRAWCSLAGWFFNAIDPGACP